MRARLLAALAALLAGAAHAAAPLAANDAAATRTPRLVLQRATLEPVVADDAGRYTLRARFAAEERAGELREGGPFTLLGRFAKAAASCSADTLFRDGFEGN